MENIKRSQVSKDLGDYGLNAPMDAAIAIKVTSNSMSIGISMICASFPDFLTRFFGRIVNDAFSASSLLGLALLRVLLATGSRFSMFLPKLEVEFMAGSR